MRGALCSALAGLLLVQNSGALKSIDAIFKGRTPPYVCDSFMYNNPDPLRDTMNPDVSMLPTAYSPSPL